VICAVDVGQCGGAKEGIIPQPREIWFRSIHSLTDVRLPAGWVGGKLANVVAVVLRIIQPTLLVDSSIYCWGLHHKFLLHLLPTNGSGIPWIHTNIYALAVFFCYSVPLLLCIMSDNYIL
jgi:hypothetical protein